MKIYLDTVGCRLNQAEIEQMASQFKAGGHSIVESAAQADLVIVNSCAVTASAASDSRQKVRQASRAGASEIILTGCLATIEPLITRTLPEVSQVISNEEKSRIPFLFLPGKDNHKVASNRREPLPGLHHRTRAFIKAQDGCDQFCTYCVTHVARGRSISVPREEVLNSVLAAENGGTREVVLSGVNLGAWGKDLQTGERLPDLLEYLLSKSSIPRIRLSSIEPWEQEDRFLDLWQDRRLCRHLHIPLESGSAAVLKRMARMTTPEIYRSLIESARRRIPGAALTTDMIVGFPGETDLEFEESLRFVREMDFAAGHVFRFSPRPGTAAEKMPGRVHSSISAARSHQMREELAKSTARFLSSFLGQTLEILWETSRRKESGSWELRGLSDNYLPVFTRSEKDRANRIDKVKIAHQRDGKLEGIITEFGKEAA